MHVQRLKFRKMYLKVSFFSSKLELSYSWKYAKIVSMNLWLYSDMRLFNISDRHVAFICSSALHLENTKTDPSLPFVLIQTLLRCRSLYKRVYISTNCLSISDDCPHKGFISIHIISLRIQYRDAQGFFLLFLFLGPNNIKVASRKQEQIQFEKNQ